MRISRIRHTCFLIEAAGQAVYIDPYLDPLVHTGLPKANLVLVSSSRYDHGTQQGVRMVSVPETRVVGPISARDDVNLDAVSVGDVLEAGGVRVMVVDAQNVQEPSIGFLIEAESQLVYYTGDVSHIEGLADHVCTILLLPISTGLLSFEDAVRLVLTLKPRLVIPSHYGLLGGDRADAVRLKLAVEGQSRVRIVILDEGAGVDV